MAIRFQCDHCHRPLNVKLELSGREGICPHCSQSVCVPVDSTLSSEAWLAEQKRWRVAHPAGKSVNSEGGSGVGDPDIGSIQIQSPNRNPPAVLNIPNEIHRPAEGPAGLFSPDETGSTSPLDEVPEAMWYVRPPGGGQFGPASAGLFRDWMNEKRVTGESWVWRQGWEDWRVASSVFSEFGESGQSKNLELSHALSSPSARIRAAYMKARRRRTMWAGIGLIGGTIAVAALVFLLVLIVQQQGGL